MCIFLYGNKVINDYSLEESGIDTDYSHRYLRGFQRQSKGNPNEARQNGSGRIRSQNEERNRVQQSHQPSNAS